MKKGFTTDLGTGMGGGLDSQYGEEPIKPLDTTIPQKTSTKIREKAPAETPQTPVKKARKMEPKSQYEGERITLVLHKGLHLKLAQLAYYNRDHIKNIVNKALQDVVDKHEKKFGELEPVPLEQRRGNQRYEP
jgi:hypothetical protein